MKGIPTHDFLDSGHFGCPGCGGALAMRLALKALGPNTVIVIPACCWTIIEGPNPQTSMPDIAVFHTAFETTAAAAAGIKAGFEKQGRDVNVVGWAGDGGTFDIGMQALSGAADRNDDILYICYDNEAYMNTGIQRSSSTPMGTWTTTTPGQATERSRKKNMPEIVAAHGAPYVATASIGFPKDLIAKIEKAKTVKGFRYIQISAPCTAGWKFPSEKTIEIAKMAVDTGLYPLYEVENGVDYTINRPRPGKNLKAIEDYVKTQKRFAYLNEGDIERIKGEILKNLELLEKKAS